MKAIKAKLNSRAGVTILYALLLLLVAGVVSAVVLAAATSTMRSVYSDMAAEQDYLTVSSAARKLGALSESERSTDTVTPGKKTYTFFHYEKTTSYDIYEEQFHEEDGEQVSDGWIYTGSESGTATVQNLTASGPFAAVLADGITAVRNHADEDDYRYSGTVTVSVSGLAEGEDLETVTVDLIMDRSGSVKATLTLPDKSYRLFLSLDCTHEHAVYTVAGTGGDDRIRNVEDTYVCDYYTWSNPVISSAEGRT